MMRKKAHVEKHNTRIAIFFVIFVFTVIFISIVVKTMQLLAQSKFDGTNRFTISVVTNNGIKVVSFSPSNQSLSVLRIEDGKKDLKLGQYLKIPIEGFVITNFSEENKDVARLMSDTFLNYNNIKTNLTIIDILRLFLISKTTPLSNIMTYSISSSLESKKVDKIVEKIFKDEEIEKENQTIEIINTTDETGLGNRLGRLVTNMGGNVIQVSTENNSQKKSAILYNGKKSYTIEKLSKVLGFKTSEVNKQTIADVTIVVGEDNKDPLSF
jgi:hypothetical protein